MLGVKLSTQETGDSEVAEKIPSWLERLLLPRLSSIEGELKAIRGEVTGRPAATRIEYLFRTGAL